MDYIPPNALDDLETYKKWSKQAFENKSSVDKKISSGQGSSDHAASSSRQEHIHDRHKNDIPSSSSRDSKVESPDHLEIQQDKRQQDTDEIKGLFSGDKNAIKVSKEKLLIKFKEFSIKEINEAKEWIDVAKKFPKKLSITRSKDIYDSAMKLLRGMPVNIENDKIKSLFSGDETKIKEIEKNFLIGLTEHFKQELKTAKELFEWAETFTKPFGSDEKWVQDGIKQQLAIALKKSQIESDKPSMANAKLKEAIRESLKDGIPVTGIPDRICGRKVTQVSGEGNDRLIRALLKGAHPKYPDSAINERLEVMRQLLTGKNIVKEGVMLDLMDKAGKNLIKYMENKGYLRQGRNLLVYQYRDGKIQCISMTDKGSNKPPYAVLLDDANKHFYAIEVPQKEY